MTKFLKFFIGLVLAFTVANVLYLFLLPRVDWEFGKTKEAYSFKDQDLKVLVFGNSTAMDGINTELLSDKIGASYNFSVGGASLRTNYIQFKNYLQHNLKPEKVLLFLSSSHTNYLIENDINPIVDYYYDGSINIRSLEDIPLFKFRWLFVENIKKLISSNHRSAQLIKGQLRIKSIVPDNTFPKGDTVGCPENNYYNSDGYEYMWQMVALCKEKDIAMEVFEMPCWKYVQNSCEDITVSKKVGSINYNLCIRNLNNRRNCDSLLDNKTDWLSKNHLNYYGSLKVTDQLIKILTKKNPK